MLGFDTPTTPSLSFGAHRGPPHLDSQGAVVDFADLRKANLEGVVVGVPHAPPLFVLPLLYPQYHARGICSCLFPFF